MDYFLSKGAAMKSETEARKPSPDEGKMPATDDVVIATHYVLVPRDMKCHKCGAPEPWKDVDADARD